MIQHSDEQNKLFRQDFNMSLATQLLGSAQVNAECDSISLTLLDVWVQLNGVCYAVYGRHVGPVK